jgi:ABC-type amino acid transport system permease subunit
MTIIPAVLQISFSYFGNLVAMPQLRTYPQLPTISLLEKEKKEEKCPFLGHQAFLYLVQDIRSQCKPAIEATISQDTTLRK